MILQSEWNMETEYGTKNHLKTKKSNNKKLSHYNWKMNCFTKLEDRDYINSGASLYVW